MTECATQLELFHVGSQEVVVDFKGEGIVTDGGLLPIRQLDQQLGILEEAARRLADPRDQHNVKYSAAELLAQKVYFILGGYEDGNDAKLLRNDPLMKTLVGRSPEGDDLASTSTLNRFFHAYTRREAHLDKADRSTLQERQTAQINRIRGLNEFLVDTFVRTRRAVPKRIVIDLDPTDVTAHGHQQLAFWHGYYDQNQYFPMLVFEGETGLPLAAWLRAGKVGAASGAVEMLEEVIERIRSHWPDVKILVRGDNGLASPEMYEFCEARQLEYCFGYATNARLKRFVDEHELEHEAKFLWWLTRRPSQVFRSIEDYQAETWTKPRRIIAKVEVTELVGINTRFCVTNMTGDAAEIYRGFYVKRGDVPERCIGELKNGLSLDRLSSPRFLANSQRLLCSVLAYLLWSLFREANAKTPELKTMEVTTARARLFKVGGMLTSTTRRVVLSVSSHWPGKALYEQAVAAVSDFVTELISHWQHSGLLPTTASARKGGLLTMSLAHSLIK